MPSSSDENRPITFRLLNPLLRAQLEAEAVAAGEDSANLFARKLVEQALSARDAPDDEPVVEPRPAAAEAAQSAPAASVDPSAEPSGQLAHELAELRFAIRESILAICGYVPMSLEDRTAATKVIRGHFEPQSDSH